MTQWTRLPFERQQLLYIKALVEREVCRMCGGISAVEALNAQIMRLNRELSASYHEGEYTGPEHLLDFLGEVLDEHDGFGLWEQVAPNGETEPKEAST